MTSRLKTIVILSEERLKKEYRQALGKVDTASIELEILNSENLLSDEWMEEIAKLNPHLFLVDLPQQQRGGIEVIEYIHRLFQLPILVVGNSYEPAFLIEAMRLGVKEFFLKPLAAEKLKEAYVRIGNAIFHDEASKAPAKIFSFLSSKGGSGTTVITTNFAVSLGNLSKKQVLVVDFDLHMGDVASFLGIKNNKYLFDGRRGASVLDPQFIANSVISHQKSGLDILSLTDGCCQKTGPITSEFKQALNHLQRNYEYICVDCPSRLNDETIAALDNSHLIFLISNSNLPALRNAQRILRVFERLGYSQDRVRLLINRYSKPENISLREIERALNFKVFWAIPNDFKSLIQSIQLGESLAQKKSSAPLVKTFYELSAEILGIRLDAEPEPTVVGFPVREGSPVRSLALTSLNHS
jgi:pilus assembly protein CpaE